MKKDIGSGRHGAAARQHKASQAHDQGDGHGEAEPIQVVYGNAGALGKREPGEQQKRASAADEEKEI